ncbi:MAG: metallophosphoesterase [Acidobacteriia bacterium]|nr:metallophosphoesterase [Terriglobia bacterium]
MLRVNPRKYRILRAGLLLGAALAGTAWPAAAQQRHARPSPAAPKPMPTAERAPQTLVGAGDIVNCRHPKDALATATLLASIPGTVFTAGDLAYGNGSAEDFTVCYDRTWGRFKERTRPALGNHEYEASSAAPYFAYWGPAAGPAGKGYYSYDLGAWHIVVLNTNCDEPGVGGCAVGSPQEQWLRRDLAEHPAACTLAYGHHALFSSGFFASHAIHPELRPLWQALYQARAEIVLAGHEHSYERFAPQNPQGRADPQNGIREFVVGTGGRSHTPLGRPRANSEVRNTDTFGVLKLTLADGRYAWEFLPQEGQTFRDSGSGTCHPR